ncbi:TRAP-T-associated universal stress protein TeaD [bioreactor metagenome]|uniref:TRAP-T-associated universal stress protein TeaD n=1 Tax=bioreactor metagenome TaxID=1076179 RepID=A0A645JFX3_9ZZZZ
MIERARNAIVDSLAAAKAKFNEQGLEVETKLLEGQVIHREIVRAAEDSHADLIIIGSHGRTGLKKLFLGSVAQSVLGESHIPVLIVRQ